MYVYQGGVSGNGDYILCVGGILEGNVGYIWNAKKEEIHRELIGHTEEVMVWNIEYLIQ